MDIEIYLHWAIKNWGKGMLGHIDHESYHLSLSLAPLHAYRHHNNEMINMKVVYLTLINTTRYNNAQRHPKTWDMIFTLRKAQNIEHTIGENAQLFLCYSKCNEPHSNAPKKTIYLNKISYKYTHNTTTSKQTHKHQTWGKRWNLYFK